MLQTDRPGNAIVQMTTQFEVESMWLGDRRATKRKETQEDFWVHIRTVLRVERNGDQTV